MWQPQSFQPEQTAQTQAWMPQSFQPLESQQSIGQPTANGEDPSPANANNLADNHNDLVQKLSGWANSPTNIDLSNLPQSGQGLNLAQKLGYGAQAIGKGLLGSVENSMIKPAVGGITGLLQRSAGYMPPATDNPLDTQRQNLSPNELGTLAMMSPTFGRSGAQSPISQQQPIGNRVLQTMNPSTAIDKLNEVATVPDSIGSSITTSADAKSIANKFYKQASSSGDTYPADFTNSLIDKTASQAPQTLAGKATTGSSPIADLADRWQVLRGKPLDMNSIQEMDEGLGDLIDNEIKPNGAPTKAGKNLIDVQSNFRDMIMNADVGEGGQALQDARKAWQQGAKMSDIERIMTRAENSDNPATAIKSGVRTILSNPTRTRGWSDEELDALRDAGDRGTLGSLFHVFGSRLGPLVGAGVGAVGGPIGSFLGGATTYGLSSTARNLATQMQMNRAQNLLNVLGNSVPKQ